MVSIYSEPAKCRADVLSKRATLTYHRQSKAHSGRVLKNLLEIPNDYQFSDAELKLIKSQHAIQQESDLQQMQLSKAKNLKKPYIERISTCQFNISSFKRRPQSLSFNKKFNKTTTVKKPKLTAFSIMKVEELRQHELGILNQFENETDELRNNKHMKQQHLRLNSDEYNLIFDRQPTFKERKAFVAVFRHKWMQEMKLTSIFDRRKQYKAAIQAHSLDNQHLKRQSYPQKTKPMSIQNDVTESFSEETPNSIDWLTIASMSTNLKLKDPSQINNFQEELKKTFCVQNRGNNMSENVKQALALRGNSTIKFANRNLVYNKYRAKSACHKPATVQKYQMPSKEIKIHQQVQIELKGEQAKINPTLQNHNEKSLNYFITELCQDLPVQTKHIQPDLKNIKLQRETCKIQISNSSRSDDFVRKLPSSPVNVNSTHTIRNSNTQEIAEQSITKENIGVSLLDPILLENAVKQYNPTAYSPQIKHQSASNTKILKINYQDSQTNLIQTSRQSEVRMQLMPNFIFDAEEPSKKLIQLTNSTLSSALISKTTLNCAPEIVKQIDMKPSVFNLPSNPLSIRSFKFQFIKNRVEKSRANNVKTVQYKTTPTNSTKDGFQSKKSSYICAKQKVSRTFKTLDNRQFFLTDQPFVLGDGLPTQNQFKNKTEILQELPAKHHDMATQLSQNASQLNKDLQKYEILIPKSEKHSIPQTELASPTIQKEQSKIQLNFTVSIKPAINNDKNSKVGPRSSLLLVRGKSAPSQTKRKFTDASSRDQCLKISGISHALQSQRLSEDQGIEQQQIYVPKLNYI